MYIFIMGTAHIVLGFCIAAPFLMLGAFYRQKQQKADKRSKSAQTKPVQSAPGVTRKEAAERIDQATGCIARAEEQARREKAFIDLSTAGSYLDSAKQHLWDGDQADLTQDKRATKYALAEQDAIAAMTWTRSMVRRFFR